MRSAKSDARESRFRGPDALTQHLPRNALEELGNIECYLLVAKIICLLNNYFSKSVAR